MKKFTDKLLKEATAKVFENCAGYVFYIPKIKMPLAKRRCIPFNP
jgi:hypothetical protein